MKIHFRCDSCGKSFAVKPELAGRKARCKQCNNQVTVPQPLSTRQKQKTPAQAARLDEGPIQTNIPASVPKASKTTSDSAARSLNVVSPLDIPKGMGGTHASNPGCVKVNKFRYITVYPKWFLIWHLLAAASIGLCFYSLWFIPVALFFLYCVKLYWSIIKNRFLHGCINPSQVVSLNPPLIATYTNLTKGDLESPVILISKQPIHKMSSCDVAVGLRIATVASYEDRFPELGHWSSFDPKPVACVSSDLIQLARVMESIQQSEWDELKRGLVQVPDPTQPGHYCIYDQGTLTAETTLPPKEIRKLVASLLSDQKFVYLASEFENVDPEKLQEATAYMPPDKLTEIWCLLESTSIRGGCRFGMAFTNNELYYNYKECGTGKLPYQHIAAAFASNSGLELLLRDGKRLYIPDSCFVIQVLGRLDDIFNAIAGRPNS